MQVDRWRDDVVPFPPALAERFRAAGCWADRTIGEQLHRVAAEVPDASAIMTATSRHTFHELDEASDRIAAGLIQVGFQPGEAVLLQVENTAATIFAWYGLLKAGLIPVATLASHRGHEIGEIGKLTEAAGHLVQADHRRFDLVNFAHRMAHESGRPRRILTLGAQSATTDTIRIEDLGRDIGASDARRLVEKVAAGIDGDDVAVFQLSGGTTSTPKVIPRLHDDYWYNAAAYARRLGWESSTRVAHVLPVIHNAGIVLGVHAAHSVGAAVVLSSPDPDELLPLMATAGVTDIVLYPALALEWKDHPMFGAALAGLQRVVLTGTKVSDQSFQLFEDRGIRVLGLYGAGEGLVMVTDPDDPPAVRQHALGSPLSELDDVRVLRLGSEEPAPDGTPGELCFSGPYTLRGYLRSPERNAEAFTSDGLYRSGDLVTVRTIAGMRCLTFEGRAKDLVNRGGEKINSAEIEGLVLQMPGVARAALIPVPDVRLGERACLVLEMLGEAPAPTLADVTAFLQERGVAKFKWPERLEIMDELPQTRVGKIDKRSLMEQITAPATTSLPVGAS